MKLKVYGGQKPHGRIKVSGAKNAATRLMAASLLTKEKVALVLTRKDYEAYRSRNAYLSAKLMTIFLEHPIIFLGYSLTDANIRLIFNDIARCLNEEQLATLSQRLIFVQRAKEGRAEGIRINRDSGFGKHLPAMRPP